MLISDVELRVLATELVEANVESEDVLVDEAIMTDAALAIVELVDVDTYEFNIDGAEVIDVVIATEVTSGPEGTVEATSGLELELIPTELDGLVVDTANAVLVNEEPEAAELLGLEIAVLPKLGLEEPVESCPVIMLDPTLVGLIETSVVPVMDIGDETALLLCKEAVLEVAVLAPDVVALVPLVLEKRELELIATAVEVAPALLSLVEEEAMMELLDSPETADVRLTIIALVDVAALEIVVSLEALGLDKMIAEPEPVLVMEKVDVEDVE